MNIPTRRTLMTLGASALAYGFVALRGGGLKQAEAASAEVFEVTHTDAEWRKLLDANQYAVLRHEGTERPYSSPLNAEHREGRFACAGCALELFSSKTKFDSGTGWPSFWKPLDGAVVEREDGSLGMRHGGALPALRWTPRARLQRRATAHRLALLHEWRLADVQTRHGLKG